MIDLREVSGAGIVRAEICAELHDRRGCYAATELLLPGFEQAVYYCYPTHWPVGCCRIHSYVGRDFTGFREGGIFLLLKTAGGYLGVLPLGLADGFSWLDPRDGRMMLNTGTLGTETLSGEYPLLVWAQDADPYRVFAETFRQAAAVLPHFRTRDEKVYPEMFRYLGWCSWEEYHLDINAGLLERTRDDINASEIPVRFMLVDDGHQDFANSEPYFLRRLRSFSPNPDKFPDGLAGLRSVRRDDGVKWFGLWLPFAAGMCGIDPEDNRMAELLPQLQPVPAGGLLPRDNTAAADAFMETMTGEAAAGFDFIKVDFMSFPINYFAGCRDWSKGLAEPERVPVQNPYRSAWRMSRALEDAVKIRNLGLLNCNSLSAYNIFNASDSVVARCSCDYAKGKADVARQHLFQSYANMPWLGQYAWGDHDMFHSSDALAGRMMAVSKALSGGPVYLSDAPADFDAGNIRPLCFDDGLLLRPLAPASPLPDSLFQEYPTADCGEVASAEGNSPFRVIAPLENGAAAVAVYHLARTEQSQIGRVAADDYTWADIMVQPYPGRRQPPPEGLVLWDWYDGTAFKLASDYEFELKPLADRLLLLCPVTSGWAVLGRFDKYLGPAAVKVRQVTAAALTLEMLEAGPLALWSEAGAPQIAGAVFADRGNGLYVAEIPAGELTILR